MFSSVRNFLYRHRRKFLFSGIAFGGVVLLSKYAEHKLIQWQNDNAKKLLDQQKRRQHYERTLDTTRIALLQLIPNVRKVLETELDSDAVIQAIKDQPAKKRELWEELKLIGFGRTLSTIVSIAVAAPVSHVMMMVLAANTLDCGDGDGERLSMEAQTRYLSCLQDLIEQQLPDLVCRIMELTSQSLASLPLTRKLTLHQLESMLQKITLDIASDKAKNTFVGGVSQTSTSARPWSQYLKEPEAILSDPQENARLRKMYLITIDILNTDDFNDVVSTLIQVGLNYVLDEAADFYMSNHCSALQLVQEHSLNNAVDDNVDNPENACEDAKLATNQKDETYSEEKAGSEEVNVVAATSAVEDNHVDCDVPNHIKSSNDNESTTGESGSIAGDINQMSCVVVKLVPMLSGLLHRALPNVRQLSTHLLPGDHNAGYYSRLVVCSQLEALAYIVYDALVISAPNTTQ